MGLFVLLAACQQSRVPAGALLYEITVTGTEDTCHPDAEEGYQETFTYAVALDAAETTIYIDDQVFAIGTIKGCEVEYNTVVIGEETEADGEVRWQLFGSADFDPGDDSCVEGENDWFGNETFEIVSTEDETLEEGCTYATEVAGTFKGQVE
ncbi:MAG: hypothetical protein ACOZNI_28365 [Myxococcota bacterium]